MTAHAHTRSQQIKRMALALMPVFSIGVSAPIADVTLFKTSPAPVVDTTNRYTDAEVTKVVRFTTNSGNMDIALFGMVAPNTVNNFMQYVNNGRYNGTIFHRSVNGFVIQGGGFKVPTGTYTTFPPNAAATPQPVTTFPRLNLEHPTGNVRGTIAMARLGDDPLTPTPNDGQNTATSQFFFNLVNNAFLDDPTPAVPDAGYAVFGKLLPQGMVTMDLLSGFIATDFSPDFGLSFGEMPMRRAPDPNLGFVTLPILPSEYLIVSNAAELVGFQWPMTVSSSNPSLVTPSLVGSNLTLNHSTTQTGVANVTVSITGYDGTVVTDVFRVAIACGPADVGQSGGGAGADGLLDNNDFVVYINSFFEAAPSADIGVQGGVAGSDGLFDNNDFIIFINQFFSGC